MTRAPILVTGLTALLITSAHAALAAKSPQDFIKDAIQGDNSEIMLGQLAQQKGGSDDVRNFGQTLVSDHTMAKAQASEVAKSLNVTPPSEPMGEAKDEQVKLSALSGQAFDQEFATYMVTDHIKDIAAFQDEATADKGPAGQLAAKQVPDLEKHLRIAQSIVDAGAKAGADAAPPVTGFLSQQGADLWRASKLAGVSIFGPDNRKVGTISDVLTGHDGKAAYLVVGVGGFLGIGQKDVAIPFDSVAFTDRPMAPAPGTAPAGMEPAVGALPGTAIGPATTGGGLAPASVVGLGTPSDMADPNAPGARNPGTDANGVASGMARSTSYPDHGKIDLTADQLKAAPTFQFAR